MKTMKGITLGLGLGALVLVTAPALADEESSPAEDAPPKAEAPVKDDTPIEKPKKKHAYMGHEGTFFTAHGAQAYATRGVDD